MVQGLPYGSKGPRALPQDYGGGSSLMVFYPSENQQDVSRFEKELLARDSKVCV
jgi:hypothetical protein